MVIVFKEKISFQILCSKCKPMFPTWASQGSTHTHLYALVFSFQKKKGWKKTTIHLCSVTSILTFSVPTTSFCLPFTLLAESGKGPDQKHL